ncbi:MULTISPECIES: hypothetical protein [Streptomyces]|uniref:Uncharacterized protein n=1 Tax=Streptomyces thermogriseus TaxID=75292 RepID=A0ABN1T306_9ACTN|nr:MULTISPECIES: hypothetical protein [Streptomyces]MDN5381868.1 hypothetical protein [Streptomyces sp. LB8]GAT80029.1 hypothetical protein STXM2123_730 [Streptomyces sp. F-3]
MKNLLGFLGFIALVQGAFGLVHVFTGWHGGLVQRIGFLDGYEIYASIALIVLACALFVLSDKQKTE